MLETLLPRLDSFAAAADIRRLRPAARIGILTRYNQSVLLSRARTARLNGFVLKQDGFEELNYAIRTMLKGGFYAPPSMSGSMVNPTTDPDPIGCLTEREKSTFALYAQGYVVKEIAGLLNISVKTAETHLNNIRRKLGLLFGRNCWQVDTRVGTQSGCLLDRSVFQE
jgi:DNA-binding NarL/FixJ family response regulator